MLQLTSSSFKLSASPVFEYRFGPAVSGKTVTCGNTSGDVTIRAIVDGASFMRKEKDTTFTLDASKQGQIINALEKLKKRVARSTSVQKPILWVHYLNQVRDCRLM